MTDEWSEFEPAGQGSTPQVKDEWSEFVPASQKETTWKDRLGAAFESGIGGSMEGLTAATGAAYGARLGASKGPIGLLAGTAGGAIIGGLGGGQVRDLTSLRRPEEFPEELRPYAYAGEVVGQSVPMIMAPYGPAITGYRFTPENMVGRFLNGIIENAKRKPVQFAVAETAAVASSAVASGIAEKAAPGEDLTRIGAEILAPLPLQIGLNLGKRISSKVGSVVNSMSPAGRQTEAGKQLSNIISQVGEENPEMIARVYRDFKHLFPDLDPKNFTAAQITGSKSLAALEVQLAKHNEKFGAEVAQRFNDSMESVRIQIDLLTRTGDPAALRTAAEMRTEYVRSLLEVRFHMAEEMAQNAASKITSDTPAARAELSKAATEAFENVLTQVKDVENELWGAVNKNASVGFDNLKGIILKFKGELPPELQSSLPKKAVDYLKRISSSKQVPESLLMDAQGNPLSGSIAGDPVGTTMGEAYQIRSALLDDARELSNAGKDNLARIYNDIAESILDDIDAAFGQLGDESYNAAREFTRQKHDVFTRSFVGEARAEGRFGDRIEPTLLMKKALAGGAEATDLRFQELEAATRFLSTRGVDNEIDINTVLNAQERIVRLAAAKNMNPTTGKINVDGLNRFIKEQDILMDRFPEVKKDLQDAVSSEIRRAELEKLTKNRIKYLEDQSALGALIKKEPVSVATKALISDSQEKDLRTFIESGRKAMVGANNPEEITKGVLSSIYSAVINKSVTNLTSGGTTSKVIDPGKFSALMFQPRPPSSLSPMDIMISEGLVDAKSADGLKKLVDVAVNLQRSRVPGTAVDLGGGVEDIIIEGASRMAGTFAAKTVAGAFDVKNIPITAYGVSANLGQQFMLKLPQKSARNFLMQTMLNHSDEITNPITGAKTTVLEMMLSKTDSPEESLIKMRRLNAWLVRQGVFIYPETEENETPTLQ